MMDYTFDDLRAIGPSMMRGDAETISFNPDDMSEDLYKR